MSDAYYQHLTKQAERVAEKLRQHIAWDGLDGDDLSTSAFIIYKTMWPRTSPDDWRDFMCMVENRLQEN